MTKEEKIKEYQKEYYLKNKEKKKEYAKKNREKIKEYQKEYGKEHYLKNKEKKLLQQKDWYKKNKDKKKEYYLSNRDTRLKQMTEYRESNKEQISLKNKEWREKNKDEIRQRDKQYYLDNKDVILEKKKQYYLDNKDVILDNNYKHWKKRMKSDPLFKFKSSLRKRTYNAFKKKSWIKGGGTEKLLGCDWETAMKHIESQFESWMNWDNHGEWHIDHIMPLASATTKEEMKKLCHYTNLQPLLAEENIRKGDKILI